MKNCNLYDCVLNHEGQCIYYEIGNSCTAKKDSDLITEKEFLQQQKTILTHRKKHYEKLREKNR